MPGKGFTHLHLHTQYSLLDGAIAVTDHGNLFGVVDFYTQAKAAGIKPILGIEAYIAPGSRFEKEKGSGIKGNMSHLILLAENKAGYHNLLKLSTLGFTEGFYHRPRIDKELLAELSEGLICTTACIGGEVPKALIRNDWDAARQAVTDYLGIFGPDRFFLEIQQHANDEHPELMGQMIELAKEMGVELVATNDVHFLNEEDFEAHDALCCINTGRKVTDPERMMYPPSVFLKSPEQMRNLFADVPKACDNTLKIAERCNVEIELGAQHAPVFHPEDGSTPEDFLKRLVYEGAQKKYGQITDEIEQRIERELSVISGKGFASYFLICWDGYCLGVCDVDPIKYDLLFERFMDPERNEMPDIDIDICQASRPAALEYVRQKYGEIAQIITFGTMKARAVIRDVCRVMDVPLAEADRLAKLIPAELKMTLDKALKVEPDLKKSYDEDATTRKVIDIGRTLEGLARHASVHACGVVISDEPLTNFLPLYKQAGSEDLITQFEGPTVEKVGRPDPGPAQ
jgi:DNA polymerase-3 subunit alpha